MSPLPLGAWRIVLKRAAHDRIVVAAAFATIVLATTLLASGPVYADAVALSGLHRTLEDAPVRDAMLAVSGHLPAADADAADERVSGAVEDVFGRDGVTVHRSALSDSFTLPALAGVPAGSLAVFGRYDDLPGHADLVEGSWPTGQDGESVEAALSEGAARALGLEPGDTLPLTSALEGDEQVTARIVGIYRPDDVDDPFWWGSPLEIEGREKVSFTTYGPLVVSEQAFLALAANGAEAGWRAAPTIGRIGVEDLGGLQERLGALEQGLADGAGPGGSLTVQTGLGGVLATAERSLLVSRSGVLVPSVQLAVLAGAALLFLAGLLAERRSLEAAILRSRGASRGDVGLLAFAEGLMLAVPAILAAPWLAALSLRILNHVGPLADVGLQLEPRVGPGAYLLATVAGLLCAAGLAVPALRSATVTSAVQEQGRPRSSGIVQRAGLDFALVVVAGLAYWQLRRYEGPVVESVQGRFGIDPLLVAAPALGLLAGALLALRVVPALGSVVERFAVSARGLVAPLGTRQLARRPARYARAAVLLTLALAIGLFASAYSATWLRSQQDRAAYDAGADIRVLPDERTGSIPPLHLASAYADTEGVDAALPVVERRLDLPGGSEPASLLAVDLSRAAGIVHVRPDLVGNDDLGELAAPLAARRATLASLALPGEPDRIEVAAAASVEPLEDDFSPFGFPRRAQPPVLLLVLRDADGLLHRIPAGELRADGKTHRLGVTLTDRLGGAHRGRPAYPLSLVALELRIDAAVADSRRGTLTIEGLTADGAPVDVDESVRWAVAATELEDAFSAPAVLGLRTGGGSLPTLDFATGAASSTETSVTFSITPGRNDVPDTVPALVTDRFLERTGSAPGGSVTIGPSPPRLALTGSVHDFPTLAPEAGGAVVDLDTYLAVAYAQTGSVSPPSEWLIDAAPGREQAVAETLRAPPFSSVSVVDRVGAEERLTRDPVALGISGALSLGFVAAAVFAIVGFAVGAAVSTAERTTEFAVLRSLGLSERQLSGWLALEGALTASFALLGGLALGALVAWLVLPFVSLAGEGGRPFPEVIVELPWQSVAVLTGGLAVALLAVLAVQLLLLRRLTLASALRAGENA